MDKENSHVSETFVIKSIDFLINKTFEGINKIKTMQELKYGLKEYLQYFYRSNIYITSLAVGNSKKSILEIYQPLKIYKQNGNCNNENYKINSDNIEFFEKYQNILLVDSAGMGKSTLIKYLSITNLFAKKVIPIIIELRNLEGLDIIDFIKKQIEIVHKNFLIADISTILKKGGFILFFDGFDEIDEYYKKSIVLKIKDFVNKYEKNYYMIASRDEPGLYTFGNFQRFGINKLSTDEAFELLKRLDNYGNLSAYIISTIKGDYQFNNVKDLLGNPLLVSILYRTFECSSSVNISYKKSDFYNQIFYALYEKHDRIKDPTYEHKKFSGLDSSDFNSVLRRFGFLCLEEHKVEYQPEEINQIIKVALSKMQWIKTSSKNILHDLIHSVPYLQDFNVRIKWIHKSFLEYFAASFICNDISYKHDIYEILSAKAYQYFTILDFCYEMDIKAFRINIIYPLLKLYLETYEHSFNSFEEIRKEDYNLRTSLLTTYEAKIIVLDESLLSLTIPEILQAELGDRRYMVNKIVEEQNILFICNANFSNNMIAKLLKEKNIDIFNTRKEYYSRLKKLEQLNSHIISYNFDFNNPLNGKNNYVSANALFLLNQVEIYNFDYDKCKKMYKEILKEIQEDNGYQQYRL